MPGQAEGVTRRLAGSNEPGCDGLEVALLPRSIEAVAHIPGATRGRFAAIVLLDAAEAAPGAFLAGALQRGPEGRIAG